MDLDKVIESLTDGAARDRAAVAWQAAREHAAAGRRREAREAASAAAEAAADALLA